MPSCEEQLRRTSADLDTSCDVVVIGGGPAGSTVGTLLAEVGRHVLILERATFPRFHVGESLIPETYGTLNRLGLIDQLKASAFPKKYSVQFVTEDGKESHPFYFDEYDPRESSQTWQVWRDQFDEMLLRNAEEKGAVVRTEARVLDVLFEEERAVGVQAMLRDADRTILQAIHAPVVVDATGQSAFLASRLGLKCADPYLRMGTIWTYFQGAHRGTGKDEGATIILQTQGKKSWFWYIPLPDDTVSVGCTGRLDYIFSNVELPNAEVFDREVARCPSMQRRLTQATRVRDYFVTKDFSYGTTQGAGPGWVLVGDALGFIDPVYSSGVFLALKAGEFSADAIQAAFATNDFSAQQLGGWQNGYAEGVEAFRKLVYAFYTPGFRFGHFMRQFPEHREHLADILMGKVFQPGIADMFSVMQDVVP